MKKPRVVVTGIGVVSPNGTGVDAFESALRQGRSGIRFIPELEALNFSCRIGGIPGDFERAYENCFGRPAPEECGNIEYASVAAMEAWRDAGLNLPEDDDSAQWNSGTIFGCGICGMQTIANEVVPTINAGKVRRLGSRIVERVMGSAVSAHLAGLLGLGNQVTSNSSACSTGTEAVIESAWRIRMGLADRMVAGGSEGASPFTWGGFDSMRIVLSRKFNDQPEKGSRPMSASACGFVPGAGSGAVILENLETAMARGARIYAEIIGGMVNCGGQRDGGSMTAPNPEGVVRCIRGAVADAGISSDAIDAINGHLTATFADPQEIRNWSRALERGPEDFPIINSTKSMIGHCLGAAGAVETVAAILELHKGFIHPSINCEDIHPEIEPFTGRIARTCIEDRAPSIIAKASFGFGDVNSCLILRKWNQA